MELTAKRTAGRLYVADSAAANINAVKGLGLSVMDEKNYHAAHVWNDGEADAAANAAHLVACWNAFEPGGAVALAREALEAASDVASKLESVVLRDPPGTYPEAYKEMLKRFFEARRRALAALKEADK